MKRKFKSLVVDIADIGDELIATKEALDRATPRDKTAWLRWLKGHIHYDRKTATNYMGVVDYDKFWGSASPKF